MRLYFDWEKKFHCLPETFVVCSRKCIEFCRMVFFGLSQEISLFFFVLFVQSFCFITSKLIARRASTYGAISGPYFPVFGLNLRIESEHRKIRIRNNSVFDHFSCSAYCEVLNDSSLFYIGRLS